MEYRRQRQMCIRDRYRFVKHNNQHGIRILESYNIGGYFVVNRLGHQSDPARLGHQSARSQRFRDGSSQFRNGSGRFKTVQQFTVNPKNVIQIIYSGRKND